MKYVEVYMYIHILGDLQLDSISACAHGYIHIWRLEIEYQYWLFLQLLSILLGQVLLTSMKLKDYNSLVT